MVLHVTVEESILRRMTLKSRLQVHVLIRNTLGIYSDGIIVLGCHEKINSVVACSITVYGIMYLHRSRAVIQAIPLVMAAETTYALKPHHRPWSSNSMIPVQDYNIVLLRLVISAHSTYWMQHNLVLKSSPGYVSELTIYTLDVRTDLAA